MIAHVGDIGWVREDRPTDTKNDEEDNEIEKEGDPKASLHSCLYRLLPDTYGGRRRDKTFPGEGEERALHSNNSDTFLGPCRIVPSSPSSTVTHYMCRVWFIMPIPDWVAPLF